MRPGRGVGGYLRAEQFEGFLAGDAWVLSQIHLTQAARAQHPHNGVPGENLACPQGHGGNPNRRPALRDGLAGP